MSEIVWLCFTRYDSWSPLTLRAIYDNEQSADAWIAGIESAYETGYAIPFETNAGPVDVEAGLTEER